MAASKNDKDSTRKIVKKKSSQYHHGDLRRALINAALWLIERKGPKGWTLRAAARKAGVSHAAPYRHFADKEQLLAAVAEEGFRDLRTWMESNAQSAGKSSSKRFVALGESYVKYSVEHPFHYGIMFGSEFADTAKYPALHDAANAAFDFLLEEVKNLQSGGVVRGGDARVLAVTAWSSMHGLAQLCLAKQLSGAGFSNDQVSDLPTNVGKLVYEGLAKG